MQNKSQIYLFNKPYNVLCKFTDVENRPTLRDYFPLTGFYPAGRLDMDSEGLVILTNNGQWQHRIAEPKHKMPKGYWVQVEGEINDSALQQLKNGVFLGEYRTQRAQVKRMTEPVGLWEREVPIRFRKNIPTTWIEIFITEGKNRQVRKMTAAVGFPTLRLIRFQIGEWTIDNLPIGHYKKLSMNEIKFFI